MSNHYIVHLKHIIIHQLQFNLKILNKEIKRVQLYFLNQPLLPITTLMPKVCPFLLCEIIISGTKGQILLIRKFNLHLNQKLSSLHSAKTLLSSSVGM